MSAENRLTTDQLAALAPGDTVTIETALGGRRPTLTPGKVVSVDLAEVVVSTRSRAGTKYVERFRVRDATRIGRGVRSELVNTAPDSPETVSHQRQAQRISALFYRWARNRADVETLRQLQSAITDYLHDAG